MENLPQSTSPVENTLSAAFFDTQTGKTNRFKKGPGGFTLLKAPKE